MNREDVLDTIVQKSIQLSESSDFYQNFDLTLEHISNITGFYCDKLSEIILCKIGRRHILNMDDFETLVVQLFIDGYIIHYCFHEKDDKQIIACDLTDDEANRLLNEYIQPLLLGGEIFAERLLSNYPSFETIGDIIISRRISPRVQSKVFKDATKILPILFDGLRMVITTGLALRHYFFEILSCRTYDKNDN